MYCFDQLYRFSSLVKGETRLSVNQSNYHSLSATESGSFRRHHLPFYHHHHHHLHHHHYHHHLIKLILLSVALTGGCLCYLTIYYQLTTLKANEADPELISFNQSSNQNAHQPHSLVVSNSPTFSPLSSSSFSSVNTNPNTNSSGNANHSQTIINTSQLEVSDSVDDRTLNNNNNIWAENGANEITVKEILVDDNINGNNNNFEETSLKQQHKNNHVSEYLSEHVQLLAVKAAHRLEVLLHEVEFMLTEIKSKQFPIDSCPQTTVFFGDISNSSFLQNNSDYFSLLPPFYKSQLLSAQITNTIFSTVTSNITLDFSSCDVLLLFSCQPNRKKSYEQKTALVKQSPLLFQQNMQMFLPNRVFVDSFSIFKNFLSSKTKLCTLFKKVQSLSVFEPSNLLFENQLCDTAQNENNLKSSNEEKFENSLPLSENKPTLSEVILVTSLNPLRAFIYRKKGQKQNQSLPAHVEEQVKLTLLTTLVLLDIAKQILPESNEQETVLPVTTAATYFHLLTFDFEISNDTEKVTLLNVANYQHLSASENTTSFVPTYEYILNDVLKLLCSTTPNDTVFKLKSQLERLLRSDELGLQGVNCHQSHRACLSAEDFQYLLDTLAQTSVKTSENDNQNEFQLLYPLLSSQNDDVDIFLNDHLEKLFEKVLLLLADHQKQKTAVAEPDQADESLLTFKANDVEYLTERMFFLVSLLNLKTVVGKGKAIAQTAKPSIEGDDHQNREDRFNYHHYHHHHHPIDTSGIYDLTNLNSVYHNGKTTADQLTPPLGGASNALQQRNCTLDGEHLSTLSPFAVLLPSYISLDLLPPSPSQTPTTLINDVFSFDEHQPYGFNRDHQQKSENPHVFRHYQASGPANYGDLLFSLEVAVAHCDAWIRLEDRVLFQSGTLNFTLGLGENVITFSLVTKPPGDKETFQVTTTFTITIHRLSREDQYYSPMPPTTEIDAQNLLSPKEVCSLKQDCQMAVFGEETPCGLQRTGLNTTIYGTGDDWADSFGFPDSRNGKLDACTDGAASGHWLVPCYSCDQESTCSWAAIQWKPLSCRYQIPVSSDHLMNCFKSRRHLLIIGDSTSRGIMNYIVERLNGTLTEADKTHNWKQYRFTLKPQSEAYLANFEVTVTFVYYPKFWIPLQKRPSFDKILAHLLKEYASPNGKTLKKGEDLVILVGGVQWIAQKHLLILHEQIKLFNISKTRIVIKSLGSGFHQPVNGVHYMPLTEQKKLAIHNAELVETARKLKFGIVDTFNKTIALYRDFYPGKCACHFHKIINKPSPDLLTYQTKRSFNFHPKLLQNQHLYHVEGHINRIYSEILFSEICK